MPVDNPYSVIGRTTLLSLSKSTTSPVGSQPVGEASWPLYVGMFLAASLAPLGSTMIAVALPSIGQELDIGSGVLTQWLVSSYLIVGIAVMSPGGKLGDRFGHSKALLLGMTIYGCGSIVGFALANLSSLAFARMSMAAGSAIAVPAAMALMRNLVPIERRARMFGYFGSVMGTAAAIGPLIGGELTVRFGWRSVFLANIPVLVIAFVLIRLAGVGSSSAPTPERASAPRFDILGSVLVGLGLTLLVVAVQTTTAALWYGMAGGALLVCFVLWEQRVSEPVLDLRLFKRRAFAAGTAVIGLQNLAMYALLFQLPIFMEQVRGVPSGTTGRTVIGMMVAMVVLSPVGGRLAERVGPRLTTFSGCLLTLLGLYTIGGFEGVLVPADVLPGIVLMGAGLGLSSAPSQAVSMSAVDRSNAGMAGAAISTARYIGAVIGISTLGFVLNRSGDAGAVATDAHTSAMGVYVVALVIATISSLMLPGRLQENKTP